MTNLTKNLLRRLLETENETTNLSDDQYCQMLEELESVPVTEAVEYRFFWGGTEYQLMSFPDEDLIGVYWPNADKSQRTAMVDIRDDMKERGIQTATINIDLSRS